jgi:hypothetical protein
MAVPKKTEPAVARAARYPMPARADPKGYWEVLLMHINAAVESVANSARVRFRKAVNTRI